MKTRKITVGDVTAIIPHNNRINAELLELTKKGTPIAYFLIELLPDVINQKFTLKSSRFAYLNDDEAMFGRMILLAETMVRAYNNEKSIKLTSKFKIACLFVLEYIEARGVWVFTQVVNTPDDLFQLDPTLYNLMITYADSMLHRIQTRKRKQ